jgi:predicted O-methyltransferase YrrM
MSDATAVAPRRPATPEAIGLAAAWFARAYRDEAEALLTLELAFDEAMMRAAEDARQEARP